MSNTQNQNPKSKTGDKPSAKPGDRSPSSGKGKDAAPGRSDPGQTKSSPRGADSREIAKEQGKPGDTPMRDHERERTDAKPKAVVGAGPAKPGEDRGGGNRAKGTKETNEDAAPSHPPGGQDEESDIDETQKAR